ncbi:hypothetical protein VSR01_10645 [Actinacidiphila sp. DG2A-62]|uniref:hypothetical protein n=1 Tax=Actinacidiphila sp. DG2A-62 TaxID=3108821 RepID=UPI002DBAD99D|nr:hypothetical protein [Actinacidiphila sp. DG2A-62]MEC3993976.1 hypothetical protein [Actinacidiphila sp. DG2A-62]
MSTDRPYTDADLRAAAMDQHAAALRDPDFTGIGEQLQGRYVHFEVVDQDHGDMMPPPGTPRWDELPEDDFAAAQRAIDDLLAKAAPISEWAINLGADGLEPSSNVLGIEAGDTPIVRVHMAFHPDMDQAARNEFAMQLGAAMRDIH